VYKERDADVAIFVLFYVFFFCFLLLFVPDSLSVPGISLRLWSLLGL
jgi:hypothetical protein